MSLAKETGHCGAEDPVSHCSCWHEPGHKARGVPHASMSGEHLWLVGCDVLDPAGGPATSSVQLVQAEGPVEALDAWGRSW